MVSQHPACQLFLLSVRVESLFLKADQGWDPTAATGQSLVANSLVWLALADRTEYAVNEANENRVCCSFREIESCVDTVARVSVYVDESKVVGG